MHRKKPYKEDAIDNALDWIRDHYIDKLGFTEDPNEQLEYLNKTIEDLYLNYPYGNDRDDAYYRCTIRKIAEALDKPLEELPRLLMEKEVKRLYYPEAADSDSKELILLAIKYSKHGLYPIDVENNPPYSLTPDQARVALQQLVDEGKVIMNDDWKLVINTKQS